MSKLLKLLLVAALTLSLFTGFAMAEEGFVVAYVCKDLSQEWFIVEADAIDTYCREMGASDVIFVDCEYDEEKYIDGVQNMVGQGVDLLIVCPPDQNLSQRTVEMCSDAGIPVIAVDDPLADENGILIAPAVQLSAYNVGVSMGEWLANYCTENDYASKVDETAVLCLAADTVSSCVPRTDGQIDSFQAAFPALADKVIRADYESTTDSGYDVMAANISGHPEVKYWCVMAVNDEGALGAVRALEAAGIDGDAVVVGCGAYHFDDEIFTKPETCFKAASYFSSIEAGTLVATEAMNYLKDNTTGLCQDAVEEGQTFGRKYFAGTCVDVTNYIEVMGNDLSVDVQ